MNNEKKMLVCTNTDLWNAADGSGFFVIKGEAKPLPEYTTPIIENGLEQGLLREANEKEIEKYEFNKKLLLSIQKREIKAGNNYEETVERYKKLKNVK